MGREGAPYRNFTDCFRFLYLPGDDKNNPLYTDESSSSIQTQNRSLHDLKNTKDYDLPDDIDSQISVIPLIEDSTDKVPTSKLPRFSLKEASETELETSLGENYDDEVEKYWKSDHHRFEWPDTNVQLRSPLSWHSLGLPVQDSFIAKGLDC
jgi:hypothetical protein